MFWFTTTGWMMWNFLVGCLLSDAAIVLYDGSPGHPDLGRPVGSRRARGDHLHGHERGPARELCEEAGVEPAERDLSRAAGDRLDRVAAVARELPLGLLSTSSPDVWLFSTSGGTDVCTAFVGGCPLLPVYEGEIQCRALGCARGGLGRARPRPSSTRSGSS